MADPIIPIRTDELPPEVIATIMNGVTVEGALLLVWWRRQRDALHRSFMDSMRQSLENGESVQQAVTRIVGGTVDGVAVNGIMNTSRRQAEALVRTAINEIVTQTRLAQLQSMGDVAKGIQQISTLDSRTSDICIAYSGQVWDIETLQPVPPSTLPFNGGPPRHFNCRSTLVPVLRSFEELGFEGLGELPPGMRASMDGAVPGDITFDAWLRRKGTAFQNELLGPGRARLWRTGKITLTQLVDFRGHPLTLEQLEDLVG